VLSACVSVGLPASAAAVQIDMTASTCPQVPAPAGVFRAGFGRADLTTPPGPGLAAYGPEGREARGYRQRIHARAFALEDGRGERLAFAVVDLAYVSASLHREVASRVFTCAALGGDRIFLAATHTHAAPGHFTEHASYDRFASSVSGYDEELLAFIAQQTAHAILHALSTLRPALAAWGEAPVWGITRIRSFDVHLREPHEPPSSWPVPAELRAEQQHVDPTLTLLRVDTLTATGHAPAGAFSVFAVHNTANPGTNDLIDADVFAQPQRELERHIDSLNGATHAGFQIRAVHVMANGAEGDVLPDDAGLPDRDSLPACRLPVLRRELRPGGARSPPPFERWIPRPGASTAGCTTHGRRLTHEVGAALAGEAIRLFDSLGELLRADLVIARNLELVALRQTDTPVGSSAVAASAGLCPRGRVGTAAAAGAETGRTRLLGRRVLGFEIGLEPGGSAVHPSSDCHSPKRTTPAALERLIVGDHPFEEFAHLAVVRIGRVLVGTVPFEATTTVGARMRAALRRSVEVRSRAAAPDRFVVLGLANGYLQYVTTASEYAAQHYEGASTLYGPASAEFFTRRLALLASGLAATAWSSPRLELPPFPTYPDRSREIMPRRGAIPLDLRVRPIESVRCAGDTLVLSWLDVRPGTLVPADGQVLSIEGENGGEWREVAWDDRADVEVRALRPRGHDRYLWQARWAPVAPERDYRVVLLERPGLDRVVSPVLTRPRCARN
jgi:neutral ceramidase